MAEKKSAGLNGEGGFTMVELMMYLAILGIFAGTAVFGYSNMRETSQVNGAAEQVKSAMQSALDITTIRGCITTLEFDSASDTYTLTTKETAESAAVSEQPPAGASYTQGSGGIHYVKLLEGQGDLSLESDLTIVYAPRGVLVDITFDGAPAYKESGAVTEEVTVRSGSKTRTLYVNYLGTVTY